MTRLLYALLLSLTCLHGECLHYKARFEKPSEYPERELVPDDFVSWSIDFPGYNPPYYVSPTVLKQPSWAEPEEVSIHPLNIEGRTGIAGRGLLGKWGPNYAADPIVTRINPETDQLELLVILRKDCQQWALPGGMVDKGERVTRTLTRELQEEAGLALDFSEARIVYQGYVDDPRNTDNAWMETTASHLHLPPEQSAQSALTAGDDALSARWIPINEALENLYANHSEFVKLALNTNPNK